MEITTTTNIDTKSSYAGIKKHVEHDKNINHSNKDIEFDKTSLNIHGRTANLKKTLNKHYGDFVRDHDERMKEQYREKRVYGSVDNYLEQSKGNFDCRMVTTFGNMDAKNEIIRRAKNMGYSESQILKAFSEGLATYARGFNKRNSHITMTEFTTNVDEKGAPHVHAQIIPTGVSDKGTPSKRLNTALKNQYGTKTNASGMKAFREQEDTALVKCIENVIKRDFKPLYKELGSLELIRTNDAKNVDMDEYKAQFTKEREELLAERDRLEKENSALRSEKQALELDYQEISNDFANLQDEKVRFENTIENLRQNASKLTSEVEDERAKKHNLQFENNHLQEQQNLFYKFIADAYSALGVNYMSEDDKNVNLEVAKGDSYVKNENGEELSGVGLIFELIKRATQSRINLLKRKQDEYEQKQRQLRAKQQREIEYAKNGNITNNGRTAKNGKFTKDGINDTLFEFNQNKTKQPRKKQDNNFEYGD